MKLEITIKKYKVNIKLSFTNSYTVISSFIHQIVIKKKELNIDFVGLEINFFSPQAKLC
jgi:hypothetical protein